MMSAVCSELISQFLAIRALVIVSKVVNVLDATMNSTVSGSRSWVFSNMSAGSMLLMNRHSMPSCLYGFRAS